MAERSKLQTTQSKLPTRDGLDSEDKNIYDLQNDIDMQINNIKIEVLDNEYLDEEELTVKSPLQFSIKVEVEEYNEKSYNINLEDDNTTMFFPVKELSVPCEDQSSPADYVLERLSVTNSEINSKSKSKNTLYLYEGNETDVCLEADHIARTSRNIIDKILAIEVRNLCGVLAKPKQEFTLLHSQIYSIYKKWKNWCSTTKTYEQPLFYKCYKCEKSWWYLGPFVEHAKEHVSEVYTIYLETTKTFLCNIVLASNDSESERFIYTEGDCWRCNKPYMFHEKTNLCYKCKGCQKYFFKCSTLQDHENICSEITHSKSSVACEICKNVFESYSDLERHRLTSHIVRSDLFIWTTYKNCLICTRKHYINDSEVCSKKCYKYVCELCSRRFTSQLLVDSHKLCSQSNVECTVCNTILPKHCMKIKHYTSHTNKFKLVYKCSLCTYVFLFWEQNSMLNHQCLWHKSKDKQDSYFELVLIPTKCMKKLKMVDPEPIAFFATGYDDAADKVTTVNMYEDEPVSVYEIKQEVVDNEESDEDVDEYIIEECNSTYDDMMANIFQVSGTSNNQIETQIKTEVTDSSDVDLANISRVTDDGEEPRLVIDIREQEEGKIDMKERKKRKKGFRKRAPKIYTCNICGYKAIHKDYREHIQTECLTIRKTKIYLERASKLHRPHKCRWCKVSFISLNGYLYHFAKTHGYKEFTCPVCLLDFNVVQRNKMAPHFILHVKQMFLKVKVINRENAATVASDMRYECKVCREVVENPDFFPHWESHFKVKHVDNEKIVHYGDNIPNVTPSNVDIEDLIKKLLIIRPNYTHRTCTICDRRFNRINDSKRHIIEHLLNDAYKKKIHYRCLRCQICKERFMKPDAYKKHLREHASLPIYKCGLCNKCFSDSSNFVKHKKIHNIKVLVCDICNNKYQAKASLEKHMEVHNATKPITCKLCSKIFYIESAYKKHNRTVHERNRAKFSCLTCDIKFNALRDKWDHMWLVHNERKYNADCPVCGKSFRKFQDVRTHVRTEHVSVDVKQMRLSDLRRGDLQKYLKDSCSLKLGAKETLIVYD